METELWPNLIDEAWQRDVPVLLVNARLSERSAKGYNRVSSVTRPMLSQLRFVACQYQNHVERFINIGAYIMNSIPTTALSGTAPPERQWCCASVGPGSKPTG